MKHLRVYKGGSIVITNNMGFHPNGDIPIEEYDLSDSTDEEFEKIVNNPTNKKLLKRFDSKKVNK